MHKDVGTSNVLAMRGITNAGGYLLAQRANGTLANPTVTTGASSLLVLG